MLEMHTCVPAIIRSVGRCDRMEEYIQFDPIQLSAIEKNEFGSGSPVVTVTAALHGEEQTSVYVARRLARFLRDKVLHGTVQIFPVCNPTAFRFRSRVSPIDGEDLNRSFCRKADGSHTYQLANRIWEEVKNSDYLLDLHCCGQHGSTYVMAQHADYTHQVDLGRALGLKNVILSSGTAGQLFVELNRTGKQGILIEIRGGQPAAAVDLEAGEEAFQAALRFLNFTGVGEFPVSSGEAPVFHGKIQRIFAQIDGFLLPQVTPEKNVCQGQVVAVLEGVELRAPVDGTILAMAKPGYLFNGDRIFTIAPYWKEGIWKS